MSDIITAETILRMNKKELEKNKELIEKYLKIKKEALKNFKEKGNEKAYLNCLYNYNRVVNYLIGKGIKYD